MSPDARRALPSVDAVVRAAGTLDVPRPRLVAAVREVLAESRSAGAAPDAAEIAAAARARITARDQRSLRRVINATGVVLQTNLGRAPLAPSAIEAIAEAAGAVSVEYDLDAGRRGERHGHASALLRELAGAEDGVVVNNNAAAVLLALASLAQRREVLVARGELVEIGGGFRIPDVLRRSGAKLVEVGTTNRTYVKDYSAAIGPRTGAILRVHASNFKVVGFVARPDGGALARLAQERGVAFIHDLGSGTLLDTARHGLPREETVGEAVAAGADVVTFSGDKLLGGPQAGLAVGRSAAIAALRAHPLMRALRPDKLTLAALIATLELYRDGRAADELPVWRMIAAKPTALAVRARALAGRLQAAGVAASVIETSSTVGGGALPEETQPSRAVAIAPAAASASAMAARLRAARPAVVARIVDGQVALDLRSVLPEDDGLLAATVTAALAAMTQTHRKGG
ncbi:MAG TPA: L-seryl-tRNA(Sec) selenium transferase [Candidatus Limnocylindria bacterium]|nr:L-seryl-tRNA(Sec) selenium transferase [Candidatus Limnocylindria bacterium]